MRDRKVILKSLLNEKIVSVVRGKDLDEGNKIINACKDGGIKLIEITYTNKDASSLIKKFSEDKDLYVGAGTVTNIETAEEALKNGASFIVGPNFDEELAEYCNNNNILYIPGCLTPTEIIRAQKYKCEIIKLFPGDLVGPKYIKAIKAPIPNMKIMVTGGVNINNISEWLESGAEALGIGSVLTEGTNMEHNQIVTKVKEFVEKIK